MTAFAEDRAEHCGGAESPRQSILVASPRQFHLRSVMDSLRRDYDLVFAEGGWEAVEALGHKTFSAIVVDADLPMLSGYDVLKRIQRNQLSEAPIIFMHAAQDRERARSCLADRECSRLLQVPFEDGALLTQIWRILDEALERRWDRELSPLQSKLLRVTNNSIKRIFSGADAGDAVDHHLVVETGRLVVEGARDRELGGILDALHDHHSYSFVHSLKVASLMTIFGVHVGMSQHDLELLAQGGLLHDIGKCHTPEALLNKPRDLDPKEWEEMRAHPALSGDILRNTPGIDEAILHIAERHHEKLDGTGYPFGLKGSQLDDPSLVASIMDIYSALTDKRSYKPAFTPEKSLEIMRGLCGHHLEPTFFGKFEEMIRDGAAGQF